MAQTNSVQNGDWNNPATWSNGVPTAADTVIVNHNVGITSPAEAYEVTVNGRLKQQATSLTVHTIYIEETGTFGQASGHQMIFLDTPPVRFDQLDGGVICKGRWIALGTSKTTGVRSAGDMRNGDEFIVLDQPVNWHVGDTIWIPHTRQLNTFYMPGSPFMEFENDSEQRTIIAIAGNVVQVEPLGFDHAGAPENSQEIQIFPDVVCKTRDSKWISQNPVNPAHVMITARGFANISHIEIDTVGRTLGTEAISDTNVIARYGVHWHFCIGPAPPFTSNYQGSLIGCTIANAQKWSVDVHHSDYILIKDNASWNAHVGFVTEDATEQHNRFESNIAMNPRVGWWLAEAGTASDDDFGSEGSGFWFRSVGNDVVDNVAYGPGSSGFVFSGHAERQSGTTNGTRPYRTNRGQTETVSLHSAPYVGSFDDNQSVAFHNGIYVLNPMRYPGPPSPTNDLRREFNNFTIWNCFNRGTLEYWSGLITWNDLHILFDKEITNTNRQANSHNNGPTAFIESTVGIGLTGQSTYPVVGDVFNRAYVSNAVVGANNARCDGVPNEFNDCQFDSQFGIFLFCGGDPAERDTSCEITNFVWTDGGINRQPGNWQLPYLPSEPYAIFVAFGDNETQIDLGGYYDLRLDGKRLWNYRDANVPDGLVPMQYPYYGLIEQ